MDYSAAPKSMIGLTLACGFALLLPVPILAADDATPKSVTTADPTIALEDLELLLKPLTQDELVVEADAWLELLKAKVAEISQKRIAIRHQNVQIKDLKQEAKEAEKQAEQIRNQAETQADPGSPVADGEPSGALSPLTEGTEPPAPPANEEGQPETEAAQAKAEEARQEAEKTAEVKTDLLAEVNQLRDERIALSDRLSRVLNELELKGGDIGPYKRYLAAVSGSGLELDVTDTAAAWHAIKGWLTSTEGGLRWGFNILMFFITLIAFQILAIILSKAADKALGYQKKLTALLRDFAVKITKRAVQFIGLMVAITMLEVNIGPILAAIGAVGFIVGFALQGTLSNFASGLMILAYRPFDVGDVINVGGVAGTVDSMNLVSTSIKTFDNQQVIVPNNSIWGGVITNVTGLPIRRVDLVFSISYGDDQDKARAILEDILKSHPLVLDHPEPVVKLHELADSSVNFICRPWVKTSDYWAVYWDVVPAVKKRFDAEGVSIPFPQRDVHLYQESPRTA